MATMTGGFDGRLRPDVSTNGSDRQQMAASMES